MRRSRKGEERKDNDVFSVLHVVHNLGSFGSLIKLYVFHS